MRHGIAWMEYKCVWRREEFAYLESLSLASPSTPPIKLAHRCTSRSSRVRVGQEGCLAFGWTETWRTLPI
jgi:hypothetical protein